MIAPSWGPLVLLATLAVFVVVGVRARAARDLDDYLVARSSQPASSLGLSFFAAGMGAWILFAPPEVGAGVGLVAVLGYTVGAAAPFAVFALLGPRIRRVVPTGQSLVAFVQLRFGRAFSTYVIALSMAYMLVFVAAELTAAAGIGALVAGLPPDATVLAIAAATLGYTAYGGLRASIRTDRFQAWIILALLALGTVAILTALDAPGAAFAGSGLLAVERVGVEAALTLVIAVTAANLFHQGYWQRVWAARGDRALRRGTAIGIAATIPVVALVGVLGVVAAGSGLDLGAPPLPFFALLGGLPAETGLAVLVLGVALVASSVDTLESGLASLVLAGRPRSTVGTARLATVLLLVPAVLVALQGFSVLRLFLVADLLCAGAVVPALLSLWPRGTSAGALSGAVAGLVGALVPGWAAGGSLADGLHAATFPGAVPTLGPFLGALLASAGVGITVSLLQRRVTDLEAVGARAAPA